MGGEESWSARGWAANQTLRVWQPSPARSAGEDAGEPQLFITTG